MLFRAQIYNKMRLIAPTNEANCHIIAKKTAVSSRAQPTSNQKTISYKKSYIFLAQHAKPINKKTPVVLFFVAYRSKGDSTWSTFI